MAAKSISARMVLWWYWAADYAQVFESLVRDAAMKKLLILGGTVFLGRHVLDAALAAGCEATLLNRGTHDVQFAQAVEQLRGDRDGDLSALKGRAFDAVVDCSGYTPAQLQRSCDALRDQVAHYVLVSTISVYARFAPGCHRWRKHGCRGPRDARCARGVRKIQERLILRLVEDCIANRDPTIRF